MNARLLLASFWLAGVVRISAAAPPPKEAQDSESRIVFPSGVLNGQPARLLLDTGASVAVLTESGARQLGVKIAGATGKSAFKLTDESPLAMSAPVHFKIGTENYVAPLTVMPDGILADAGFDGLIGWNELKDDILVFDPARHTVSQVEKLPPEAAGWQKFKIHPASICQFEIPLPDGQMGVMAVDTGSDVGAALSPEQWNAWQQAHPDAAYSSVAYLMPGAGGVQAKETVADEITFGALKLANLSIREANGAETANADHFLGSLGLPALNQLHLIIDRPDGLVFLQPLVPAAPAGDWKIVGNVRLNLELLYAVAGAFKFNQGDKDGANADWARGLELYPRSIMIPYYRGVIEAQSGNAAAATADFSRVLELDPQNASAKAQLAQLSAPAAK